ncbi:hypothetical protein Tco_0264449 [Tanacetum coccineum]
MKIRKMLMLALLIVVLMATCSTTKATRNKLMGRTSSSVNINNNNTSVDKIINFFKFNDEERLVPTGSNPLHNSSNIRMQLDEIQMSDFIMMASADVWSWHGLLSVLLLENRVSWAAFAISVVLTSFYF